MGEARRRGTKAERVAQGIIKEAARERQRIAEMKARIARRRIAREEYRKARAAARGITALRVMPMSPSPSTLNSTPKSTGDKE